MKSHLEVFKQIKTKLTKSIAYFIFLNFYLDIVIKPKNMLSLL